MKSSQVTFSYCFFFSVRLPFGLSIYLTVCLLPFELPISETVHPKKYLPLGCEVAFLSFVVVFYFTALRLYTAYPQETFWFRLGHFGPVIFVASSYAYSPPPSLLVHARTALHHTYNKI